MQFAVKISMYLELEEKKILQNVIDIMKQIKLCDEVIKTIQTCS